MKKSTVSLDHLNFSVRSFAESALWYQNTFGFEKVEEGVEKDGPWGVLRAGDAMLCIYESPKLADLRTSPESEKFHYIYHFGIRIHDREKWEQTVERHKIHLYYGGAIRYPHSTSWYVKDPTGYMIEVALWDQDEVKF